MSKMKVLDESIVFSTGKVKKMAANGIGIRMIDDEFNGKISICDAYGDPISLDPEESIELADAVIARWEQFKKQVSKD